MSEAVLRASGLARTYRDAGSRGVRVLAGCDLDLLEGEAVAIVGESGVGKSTLLHILGGLDRPDAGTLAFRGEDVFARGAARLADYRNRSVGFVFQFHHLLPEFTAVENVEMPARIGRDPSDPRPAAVEILGRLGLGERLHHTPSQLSGGEQQRVAIARAVVRGPAVVLADEPTGNLDPSTGREVFEVLRGLQAERRFALLVATHSGKLARRCDRILRLDNGFLRPIGEAEARDYFDGVASGGA
jgi:lipoprotein-releasing system ATP-binding protein